MKVVINNCYGGFSLSNAAEDLYAEKKGFKIYRYRDGDKNEFVRCSPEHNDLIALTFTKDKGDSFSSDDFDDGYWYSSGLDRHDPVLVSVVEELGHCANGMCASLKVVEIPDDVEYEICEYDGREHVAEQHRTWS